jgi:hypothetical protein
MVQIIGGTLCFLDNSDSTGRSSRAWQLWIELAGRGYFDLQEMQKCGHQYEYSGYNSHFPDSHIIDRDQRRL